MIIWRRLRAYPPATATIITLCIFLWLLQMLLGSGVTTSLAFAGAYVFPDSLQPWRIFTSMFLHSTSTPLHLLFNMYSLWWLGSNLEQRIGSWRFLALYFISGLGAAVGIVYLQPYNTLTLGASGGIFGLLAAFIVLRIDSGQLWGIVGLNLIISFLLPGISWQAHIGGLLSGFVAAWAIKRRNPLLLGAQVILLIGVIATRPYLLYA